MTDERLEQTVHQYGDMVFRVACHAVGNRIEAEDVTQTVFLRLCQREEVFESEAHLKHWLLRVAVNEGRRIQRSPWRRRVVPLEEWDAAAEEREESGVLSAVMALEAKYRIPIYLYYYEGYTVREVAEILGINASTVQTRLQRSREKLRRTLSGKGEEENGGV